MSKSPRAFTKKAATFSTKGGWLFLIMNEEWRMENGELVKT